MKNLFSQKTSDIGDLYEDMEQPPYFIDQQSMGSNDLYVIKKLKESNISLEKLELYLKKVFASVRAADGGLHLTVTGLGERSEVSLLFNNLCYSSPKIREI